MSGAAHAIQPVSRRSAGISFLQNEADLCALVLWSPRQSRHPAATTRHSLSKRWQRSALAHLGQRDVRQRIGAAIAVSS